MRTTTRGDWANINDSDGRIPAMWRLKRSSDLLWKCNGGDLESAKIIKIANVPTFESGDGVVTTLLVGRETAPGCTFTSGLTSFPAGRCAPLHSHNCGEQVTLLEGEGEVEVEGQTTYLEKYDTTYIPPGNSHRFSNVGKTPLVILWIYDATRVTRTFTDTGKTVDHLSVGDSVQP